MVGRSQLVPAKDQAENNTGFNAVLKLIAEQARHATRADGIAIRLRAGSDLQCAAQSGLRIKLDARFAAQCTHSGEPLRLDHLQSNDFELDDFQQDPNHPKHHLNASSPEADGSAIIFPVLYRQETVGVLEVFSSGRGPAVPFSPEDSHVLRVMSEWIASALSDAATTGSGNTAGQSDEADSAKENGSVQNSGQALPMPPVEGTAESFPQVSIFATEPSVSVSIFRSKHTYRRAAGLAIALLALNVALVVQNQNKEDASQRMLRPLPGHHSEGITTEAISALEAAVKTHPMDPQTHYNLGTSLYLASQFQKAASAFREALQLSPDFPNAHSGLGQCFIKLNDYDRAIAEFYQAVAADAGDSDSHYYLGLLLATRGMPQLAIAEYKKALEIDPDHAAAHSELARASWSVAERSKSKPSANSYYHTAWKEVHATQSLGGRVDSVFVAALRQRMPEPNR